MGGLVGSWQVAEPVKGFVVVVSAVPNLRGFEMLDAFRYQPKNGFESWMTPKGRMLAWVVCGDSSIDSHIYFLVD
jgi:hypothetical protein